MNEYVNDIEKFIIDSKVEFEGNCFYQHHSLTRREELFSKQVNLFWIGTTAKKRICEIGINAGHSLLLMLLGNESEELDVTIFDLGTHKYTDSCFDYIKSKFPKVNMEFIKGNSIHTVPIFIKNNKHLCEQYDIVHVDGGHTDECIFNDIVNSDKIVKLNGFIIVDDTNDPVINRYVDLFINSGKYIEIDIIPTHLYPHRIIQRVL